MLAALLLAGTGWITLQQQHYGASVREFELNSYGEGLPDTGYNLFLTIGRLWNFPENSSDTHGLGSAITYAWDPNLCGKLQPRFSEDISIINFIDCADIKAAFARGLNHWAENHRFVSFLDVTDECARIGDLSQSCRLAEVWVSSMTCDQIPSLPGCESRRSRALTARELQAFDEFGSGDFPDLEGEFGDDVLPQSGEASSWAAAVYNRYRVTSDFRFTHGGIAFINNDDGTTRNRNVVEVVGSTMVFNVDSSRCWYLDSAFCSSFHSWKQGFPGDSLSDKSNNAQITLICIIFFFWSIATVYVLYCLIRCLFPSEDVGIHRCCRRCTPGRASRPTARLTWQDYRDYFTQMLKALAEERLITLTMAVLLCVALPLMYFRVFLPCWDCWDFESAVVHEAGHVLGFGHPDDVNENPPAWSPGNGSNVYNAIMASGGVLNPSNCAHPWDQVFDGTPPGAALEPSGVRNAVMEAFTQNNPKVCLTEDDLEALQTLYPDCQIPIGNVTCQTVALNIGAVRVTVYVLIPLFIALFCLLLLGSCIQSRLDDDVKQLGDDVDDAKAGLALARWKLAKDQVKEQQAAIRNTQANAERSGTALSLQGRLPESKRSSAGRPTQSRGEQPDSFPGQRQRVPTSQGPPAEVSQPAPAQVMFTV